MARGELLSLVEPLRCIRCSFVIEVSTADKGVGDKFQAGRSVASLSSNCDLYNGLGQTVIKKDVAFENHWMPSHLGDPITKKARPSHISDLDIEGNFLTDEYADIAAAAYTVSLPCAADCVYNHNLVMRIRLRLAPILPNLFAIQRRSIII